MTVRLYEVGGSIRNEALTIPVNDRDFVGVCDAGWSGLVRWADENLDKIFLTTPEFFTIRGIKDKEIFDIVLARKDGAYSDGRHPDEVEPGTLEDDLARRDFTMNAIARCVDTGKLFDPFNGFSDIENGIIRCVGDDGDGTNACNRIREDVLRIVRAMRFSVTLPGMFIDNYLARILIDDELMTTGEHISDLLASVSRDRIRQELLKMFSFDTIRAAGFLFGNDRVAYAIRKALFGEGDDIWLKPTTEKK
jgi:tRNA nucleotidyltransferase (CCA-adding enzyme)